MLDKIDYDLLDPGIKDIVKALREDYNFDTTDSGDGSKFGIDDTAMEVPMVACRLYDNSKLVEESNRLLKALNAIDSQDWHVEASYSPNDNLSILVAFVIQ